MLLLVSCRPVWQRADQSKDYTLHVLVKGPDAPGSVVHEIIKRTPLQAPDITTKKLESDTLQLDIELLMTAKEIHALKQSLHQLQHVLAIRVDSLY